MCDQIDQAPAQGMQSPSVAFNDSQAFGTSDRRTKQLRQFDESVFGNQDLPDPAGAPDKESTLYAIYKQAALFGFAHRQVAAKPALTELANFRCSVP